MKFIGLGCIFVSAALSAWGADTISARDFYRPYREGAGQKTVAYKVQPGETLFDIAEKLMGDPYRAADLAKRNGIKDPLHLEAGSVIQVPAPRLAIRYSIHKLTKGRDVTVVDKGEPLEAGDRFQMWLATNIDGYLYIFNRTADDDIRRVFPAGDRTSAHVRRFSEYLVPRDGWFRLDADHGDEELWVLVSPEKLTDLDAEAAASDAAAKRDDERKSVAAYFNGKKAAEAKGIVLDDSDEDGDPSVVVEGPDDGSLVFAYKIPIRRGE